MTKQNCKYPSELISMLERLGIEYFFDGVPVSDMSSDALDDIFDVACRDLDASPRAERVRKELARRQYYRSSEYAYKEMNKFRANGI